MDENQTGDGNGTTNGNVLTLPAAKPPRKPRAKKAPAAEVPPPNEAEVAADTADAESATAALERQMELPDTLPGIHDARRSWRQACDDVERAENAIAKAKAASAKARKALVAALARKRSAERIYRKVQETAGELAS